MISCYQGNLFTSFPMRDTGLSPPPVVQLCCVSDFAPPALFLSLKCSELSSSTTKHQRPPQANINSGSGVRSPTCLTADTPATSCVTCDVLSTFHSDLLVGESSLSSHASLVCPNIKLTGLVPSHALQPFITSDSFLPYSSYSNKFPLIKRKNGYPGKP